MFTKNNPEKGFVNGTLGVITGYRDGFPLVKITSGTVIHVEPMDWTVSDNGRVIATITQIPLRLAWAMTIHKSQGMSLDSALMDLSQVFEYGQGYVALSRVRTLAGLHVLGYNDRALEVHPRVQQEDKEFKEQSDEAEYEFHRMRKDELKKLHENYIKSIGGGEGVALEKEEPYKKKPAFVKRRNFNGKKAAKKAKVAEGSDLEYDYEGSQY
jgi:ATP-dependent exoDNAse (exonuclease V) alpha subunit